MSETTAFSWAVRVVGFLGALAVGGAAVQPWGYTDESGHFTTAPTQAVEVVLGAETVAGAVSLALALLCVPILLWSWTPRSVVAVSVLGALIELFGLTQIVTDPPEATVWPLVLLVGGTLILGSGLAGVGERLQSGGQETIPSSSVVIAGGFLVVVSPLFGQVDCLRGYPCFMSLWDGNDYTLTAPAALFGLVLALTRRWTPRTQLLTVVLGAVASLVGVSFSVLFLFVPSPGDTLDLQLFAVVGTLGCLLVLVGGSR